MENNSINFQKRIGYYGDITPLLNKVCDDFKIGKYLSHKVVLMGYEDFNLILKTSNGKFFIKIFAKFRDKKDCQRYVEIVEHVLKAEVSHPPLYKSPQGYLYEIKMNETTIRLIVTEYIEGKTFFELNKEPNTEEMSFIVKQATLINSIKLKPSFVYDNWAITNFLDQYDKKAQYLDKEDAKLISPLIETFKSLAINNLPHCFAHGDITKTNTMKDKNGKIYILDFAVANYYPRIQELAVLICDLLSKNSYEQILHKYQKYIKLTSDEIKKLPLYVKLAHAMHILCGTYEKKVNHNTSAENEYFIKIGRTGLQSLN